MIRVAGSVKPYRSYSPLFRVLAKVPGLAVATEKIDANAPLSSSESGNSATFRFSIDVAEVDNSEFESTIQNWIDDFLSSEDWIGYDQLYEDEDYKRIIQAMKLLDPHYTEFKNAARLQNYPQAILIFADMGDEVDQDHVTPVSYELKMRVSATKTVGDAITVHILKPRKAYQRRRYRSKRQIILIFLIGLAFYLEHSRGLRMSENADEMIRTYHDLLPDSDIPGLFEELLKEYPDEGP